MNASQPCEMCDSALVNQEMDEDADLSYITIGKCLSDYRLVMAAGGRLPPRIEIDYRDGNRMQSAGVYYPKFCPNCGRRITEKEKGRELK